MKGKTSDVLLPGKYYVYILQSQKDSGFYIGYSTDLKVRLTKHAKGDVISTRLRRPFNLIYYEFFINENDAKAREKFLKSGYGREQLKSILKRTLMD
jgi:putative endonuclease